MRDTLFLSSLLWVLGLALWAGPARALTISVADGTGSPGGIVEVAVSVDNVRGIAGGDLTLSYDSAVLTAKGVRAAELLTSGGITLIPNLGAAGQVKVAMAGAVGLGSGSGTLLTISFEVKAGVAAGASALSLQATLRDENGSVLPATTRNGTFTVEIPPPPPSSSTLSVSVASLAFDDTRVNSTSRKTFTVSNTGSKSQAVTIAIGGTDASQFRVSPLRFTLAAKGIRTVTVTFAPTAAGSKTAALAIAAAGSQQTVTLGGKGVGTEVPSPGIQLSVGDGTGSPGGTAEVAISVDNARGIAGGDLILSYDSAVLTAKGVRAGDLLTSGGITLIPNLGTAGQVKVAMAGATGLGSGSGTLLTISFEVKAGAVAGTSVLSLQATLRDENGSVLPATTRNGTFTGGVPPPPPPPSTLSVSVASLAFDDTRVNTTSRKTFTVSNTDSKSQAVAITIGGTDASQFRVSPLRFTLAAKGIRTVTVTFAPTTTGNKAATLAISAAGNQQTVTLSGTATAATARGLSAGQDQENTQRDAAKPTGSTGLILALGGNYPNPFNAQTLIRYQLPDAALVRLEVYGLLGQLVRTLVEGVQVAGYYQAIWDGRDEAGLPLSSGVYICRLESNGWTQTRRMLLLK